MPRLTAERIYRWLIEQELPPQEVGRIRGYFYADDHRIWHNPPELDSRAGGDDRDEGGSGEKPDIGDTAGGDEELPPPDETEGDEQSARGGRATGEKRDHVDGRVCRAARTPSLATRERSRLRRRSVCGATSPSA